MCKCVIVHVFWPIYGIDNVLVSSVFIIFESLLDGLELGVVVLFDLVRTSWMML